MLQSTALEVLKSGANVFLTGQAGAGKTYVLNQYIDFLRARRVRVSVTASTGIAATQLNGMTIHTWSGIGVKDALSTRDLKQMQTRQYLKSAMERARVLVIDEISMLHGRQLALVDQVLRHFKDPLQAFGGIQVIVCGDFFQLPPVGRGEASRDKFAFMNPVWVQAGFQVCYLTEQHRQGDSGGVSLPSGDVVGLNEILNALRSQELTEAHLSALDQTRTHELAVDAPRLYTHNASVDRINLEHLGKLPGVARSYQAETDGPEGLVASLSKSVRAPANLQLKVGTKVMFTRNDFEQDIVNGTLGEVTGFTRLEEFKGLLPEVQLTDGSTLIVTPATWSIDNDQGKPQATYEQLPLCYAWAITVHKSQGMTLDSAEIDLSSTFEPGQGYVALSRLRSLAGMRLLGFNERALSLDPLALKADKRFFELSAELELTFAGLSEEEKTDQQNAFLKHIGATSNPYVIAQIESAQNSGESSSSALAKGKVSLLETKMLLTEGLSIAEAAAERGLAESTVVNHLGKLLAADPNLEVGHLRPEAELIEQVKQAAIGVIERGREDEIDEDGQVKLRPIFAWLGEKVSYAEIRLALVFVRAADAEPAGAGQVDADQSGVEQAEKDTSDTASISTDDQPSKTTKKTTKKTATRKAKPKKSTD